MAKCITQKTWTLMVENSLMLAYNHDCQMISIAIRPRGKGCILQDRRYPRKRLIDIIYGTMGLRRLKSSDSIEGSNVQ